MEAIRFKEMSHRKHGNSYDETFDREPNQQNKVYSLMYRTQCR